MQKRVANMFGAADSSSRECGAAPNDEQVYLNAYESVSVTILHGTVAEHSALLKTLLTADLARQFCRSTSSSAPRSSATRHSAYGLPRRFTNISSRCHVEPGLPCTAFVGGASCPPDGLRQRAPTHTSPSHCAQAAAPGRNLSKSSCLPHGITLFLPFSSS